MAFLLRINQVLERLPEPHLPFLCIPRCWAPPSHESIQYNIHGICYLRMAVLSPLAPAFLALTPQDTTSPLQPLRATEKPLPLEQPPTAQTQASPHADFPFSACTANTKNASHSPSGWWHLLHFHRNSLHVLSQEVKAHRLNFFLPHLFLDVVVGMDLSAGAHTSSQPLAGSVGPAALWPNPQETGREG